MNTDQIRSVLYGVAVGDALGAPCEFRSAKDIQNLYGRVDTMIGDPTWAPGEFTDDTWLTLATCYAYVDGKFQPEVAGKNMVNWMRVLGKGIGSTTAKALGNLSSGRTTVFESGKKALASSGKMGAGNGSLMRCAATGIVRTKTADIVEESRVLSEITHADPRCVWSCVAYNLMLAELLKGQTAKDAATCAWNLVSLTQSKEGREVSKTIRRWTGGVSPVFDPADKHSTGFVLRAFERALYSLNAPSFKEGIVAIVNEGGDADTNAAIAGGLLGAKFGFDAIPKEWVDALQNRNEIEDAVKLLEAFIVR